tara:strand:- start:220 stop:615 length:396 start_codon:yes stop_codon:yes gene_type:complete
MKHIDKLHILLSLLEKYAIELEEHPDMYAVDDIERFLKTKVERLTQLDVLHNVIPGARETKSTITKLEWYKPGATLHQQIIQQEKNKKWKDILLKYIEDGNKKSLNNPEWKWSNYFKNLRTFSKTHKHKRT